MANEQAPTSTTPSSVPTPAEAANMPADAPNAVESDAIEASDETPVASPKATDSKSKVGKAAQEVKKEEKRLKKLRLKVDGKEFDEEVNLDDDDYLTKQLQLAKAASKRMQEFSSLQKEVATFIEQLRKDPKKVLSDPNIGIDIKQLAAQVIEEEISNSKKSPEQIEKEKLQAQLKQIEEERRLEKEGYQKREFERIQQQEYERYDVLMTQTLEKSDLPKTPYTIKKMADYMLLGLQQGLDVTPDDVLPLVRDEMMTDLKQMFEVMPDEVIEKMVGKDVLTRLRKKNLAKAKENPPKPLNSSVKDTGKTSKDELKKAGEKKSFKDFFGV